MARARVLAACLVLARARADLVPSERDLDRFLPAFKDGQSPQTPCTCPNAGQRDKTGDHGSLPCDQGARADAGGQPCLWWSQGCTIGCETCVSWPNHKASRSNEDLCNSGVKATVCDPRLRTYNMNATCNGRDDLLKHNPSFHAEPVSLEAWH